MLSLPVVTSGLLACDNWVIEEYQRLATVSVQLRYDALLLDLILKRGEGCLDQLDAFLIAHLFDSFGHFGFN